MLSILVSMQGILSIMLMIFLGYFLTSRGWFDKNSSRILVKLVVSISLPMLMMHELLGNFDRAKLLSGAHGLVVPFISITLCYLTSFAVVKLVKINPKRQGVFRSMFFNSNTIFMGLPINLALFGERSVPYVLLYYIANTTYFWTLGVYEINMDGGNRPHKIFFFETIKEIISPPLLGYLAAVILILFNIKLPIFIMDTLKYLGNMTTPISMIFIGITIHSIDLKSIRFDKDMLALFFGRFLVSPLTILLLSMIFPIPKLMRNVFVIQAAMPVMTNAAIVARAYGADSEYVAIMIAATTIATLFVVPVFMAVLNVI